jgi:hypothetical protein
VDSGFIQKVKDLDALSLHNIGWNCRILLNGGKLPQEVQVSVLSKLKALVQNYKPPVSEENAVPVVKPTLKANRSEYLMGELEALIDKFYLGLVSSDDHLSEWFITQNVQSSEVAPLASHIEALIAELQSANKGKDEQLKEAYPSKSKNADAIAFFSQLQNELGKRKLVVGIPKKVKEKDATPKVRKARKKKEKPASKIVAKVKYLADAGALGKSLKPEDIIKASQVWLYNVKTRKLTVLNAQTESGLMVKGTSIIGWDEKTSSMKRIRKPAEILKSLNEAGKVTLRKFMDGIKTASNPANGRINKDTMIVRIWK